MIWMLCGAFCLSLNACKTLIVPPAGVDILGFIENDKIVGATGPIVAGVIVTEGFILEYKRLQNIVKGK